MTGAPSRIVLRNDFSDLPRAHMVLRSWLDKRRAGAVLRFDADLVIEEIVTNLIKYAWPEGGDHNILIDLDEEEGHVLLRFEDDGTPFDPRSAPDPGELQLGRPGGLGLHLVRRAADRIDYETGIGFNRLTVRLREPLVKP